MRVGISHPTDRTNFTRVTLGELVLFFSYETPIAFIRPAEYKPVVTQNYWGPTTGKHLNYIDGGDKTERLDDTEFQRELGKVLAFAGVTLTE